MLPTGDEATTVVCGRTAHTAALGKRGAKQRSCPPARNARSHLTWHGLVDNVLGQRRVGQPVLAARRAQRALRHQALRHANMHTHAPSLPESMRSASEAPAPTSASQQLAKQPHDGQLRAWDALPREAHLHQALVLVPQPPRVPLLDAPDRLHMSHGTAATPTEAPQQPSLLLLNRWW